MNENNNSKINKTKPDGLGVAGAILSIIGSTCFTIIFLIFWISCFINGAPILGIIWLLLFIANILTIIISALFLSNYKYKILSGVLGVIFGGFLGGIFILACKNKDIKNE